GAELRIELATGTQHVHQCQADGCGYAGGDEEEAHRLATDPAYLAEVAERCHAHRHRGEDQRDHDHEQHPQEHLPNCIGDVVRDAEELATDGEVHLSYNSEHHAQDKAQ